MRGWVLAGAFVAGLCISGNVAAESVTWFDGLYQYPAEGDKDKLAEGELYQRQDYPLLGGVLGISAYDGITVEFPEDGEYWIVRLTNADTGRIYTSNVFVYSEPEDCLYYDGSLFYCGLLPEESPGNSTLFITLRYQLSCVPTLNYQLEIQHGVGGMEVPLSDSPYQFRPTRFPPKIIAAEIPFEMKPQLPEDNLLAGHKLDEVPAQQHDITVVIYDGMGCGQPLDNVKVKLTNTISPGSAGHAHFDGSEEKEMRGTGEYVPLNGSLDSVGTDEVSIEGLTRNGGFYRTAYKPGEFGLSEETTVEAWREKTDKEPRQEDETRALTDIRVTGLYRLPTTGENFRFVFGGTCAHSPLGIYVTPLMHAKVRGLADEYLARFGALLSLNDASLPFGGTFDNFTGTRELSDGSTITGEGGREWLCHESHRRGIDIDVNVTTRDPENPALPSHSLADYFTVNGAPKKRVDALTEMACQFAMKRVIEPPVHYRSVNKCEVSKQ